MGSPGRQIHSPQRSRVRAPRRAALLRRLRSGAERLPAPEPSAAGACSVPGLTPLPPLPPQRGCGVGARRRGGDGAAQHGLRRISCIATGRTVPSVRTTAVQRGTRFPTPSVAGAAAGADAVPAPAAVLRGCPSGAGRSRHIPTVTSAPSSPALPPPALHARGVGRWAARALLPVRLGHSRFGHQTKRI